MRVLILDDDEQRHAGFRRMLIGVNQTHVYNYDEAVKALQGPRFDIAYLDHDLSDLAALGAPPAGERTGTDVARYIAGMPSDRRPTQVIVHSYNVSGAIRMAFILHDAGVPVQRRPYRGPK